MVLPPTYKTCWLAGGGSTIRGVPETDSVEPFVCTTWKGRRGTFAIMADGKVRFIPADMRPETFQALCTIAGGEKIDNLDTIAPVADEGTVLKPKLPGDLPKSPTETSQPVPSVPPEGKKAEGGKPYTSMAGRYSVSFKEGGKKVETKQDIPTPVGKLIMHVHGYEYGNGDGALMVLYNDYPPALLAGGAKLLLDGAVKGVSTKGKLMSDKAITVEGNPGREIRIDVASVPLTMRVFLVKNRMYQLMVTGKPEVVSAQDTQKFFDSFKLSK